MPKKKKNYIKIIKKKISKETVMHAKNTFRLGVQITVKLPNTLNRIVSNKTQAWKASCIKTKLFMSQNDQ